MKVSRARIHAILAADGFRRGTSKYDAEGYTLIDYVDSIGVAPAAAIDAREYACTLEAAGLPVEWALMTPLVPREVTT